MAKRSAGTAALSDGRIIPNHFTDFAAQAAALGGVQAPAPQFPGAVPAPNPDPNAIPVPQQLQAAPRHAARHAAPKKVKRHKK